MVQGRHQALSKERQAESDRANAADVARAAFEVQLVSEQQRTAQLVAKLQEGAADSQVQAINFAVIHQNGKGVRNRQRRQPQTPSLWQSRMAQVRETDSRGHRGDSLCTTPDQERRQEKSAQVTAETLSVVDQNRTGVRNRQHR